MSCLFSVMTWDAIMSNALNASLLRCVLKGNSLVRFHTGFPCRAAVEILFDQRACGEIY